MLVGKRSIFFLEFLLPVMLLVSFLLVIFFVVMPLRQQRLKLVLQKQEVLHLLRHMRADAVPQQHNIDSVVLLPAFNYSRWVSWFVHAPWLHKANLVDLKYVRPSATTISVKPSSCLLAELRAVLQIKPVAWFALAASWQQAPNRAWVYRFVWQPTPSVQAQRLQVYLKLLVPSLK